MKGKLKYFTNGRVYELNNVVMRIYDTKFIKFTSNKKSYLFSGPFDNNKYFLDIITTRIDFSLFPNKTKGYGFCKFFSKKVKNLYIYVEFEFVMTKFKLR